MNSNFFLAWETFEFYSNQLREHEEFNVNLMQTIQNFTEANPNPKPYQRKRLLKKSSDSHLSLCHLYKKQINSIEDLIELNKDLDNVPEDHEIDLHTLYALKNMTFTLIKQMNDQQEKIKQLLS